MSLAPPRLTAWRHLLLAAAAASAMSLLPAGSPPAVDGQNPSAESGKSGTLTYRLAWNWGRAEKSATGWSVRTNRGYQVRLDAGYLVSHGAELNPAEPVVPAAQAQRGWLDLIAPPLACAAHARALNPAAVRSAVVESLASPGQIQFDTVRIAQPAVYTRAHYLIARADPTARFLPADIDMAGASLYVAGAYRRESNSAWTRFQVRTGMANGMNCRLFPAGAYGDETQAFELHLEGRAEVIITRDLGRLFDEIDFATANANALAWQMLSNAITATRIEVIAGGPFFVQQRAGSR